MSRGKPWERSRKNGRDAIKFVRNPKRSTAESEPIQLTGPNADWVQSDESSGPWVPSAGSVTREPIPGFVVDLDLGPADVVNWIRRRFPGREVSISRDDSRYGLTHRLVLDGKVEHLAVGQCSRPMALMAYRWLHWQDRHGLRAEVQATQRPEHHLSGLWTAYRHRVPGSRRALALALHRTIPGTMRAFPGVGE